MKRSQLALAVAVIGALLAAPAAAPRATAAATPTRGEVPVIRVGAIVAPPFVMQQNGSLTGFNIELWEMIAARLNRKTSYQLEPDVAALEAAMRSGTVDLTVVPVFVTSARAEEFDFSYPILETGLQIMVRDTHHAVRNANPLRDMLHLLLSRATAMWLGMALLLVLIPAHAVWLLERRHENGMISSRRYFPGIFEATYWALSTLTTQAESMPRHWLARGLSILWMFAGVVFVASYTAQLTTTLTVEQIRGAIEGPDDLPAKRVATAAHTLAVDYLLEHHAQVQEFETTDQLFKALEDRTVDAVVTASPILRYHAAHEGKGTVKIVGPEIDVAPVALMEQLNSPLRKKIDASLLRLREDGSYQRLYDKWFGRAE